MPRKKKTESLTEKQRQDLARFVEKINTMVPSEYQEAIFEHARSQAGRYVVDAGPGSGKTTTAIKASSFFKKRSLFLAFNRKIKEDTKLKLQALKSKASASTLHSFGLSCLIAYRRGAECEVDDNKYEKIISGFLDMHWKPFLERQEESEKLSRIDCEEWSETLVHFVQVSLSGMSDLELRDLVSEFDLDDINLESPLWPLVLQIVPYAIHTGIEQFKSLGTVSFDDMIYYPYALGGVPVRTYEHIVLDEAQDASRAGLALLMRACTDTTQVFAIGDAKQSINAFAGADEQSIPRIIESLGAETLSLRVCYRCGTSIIDLANQLDGNIIPAPDAQPGKVEVLAKETYLKMLEPGDAVIGRIKAVLVQDCLKVLQTGRRARVLGKDLGKSIAAVVSRLQEIRNPKLLPDLSNFALVLAQYHSRKRDEVAERKKLENSAKDFALEELNDQVETVKAFYLAYISKCLDRSLIVANDPDVAYDRTANDLKLYIKNLFVGDDETNLILFLTAHKSKGGEWRRVFVTGTDKFPHPKAKSDKQQRQEINVMYVTITRAVEYLGFVDAPFACLRVPGYDPAVSTGLTIIAVPALDHLEIHPASAISEFEDVQREQEFEQPTTVVEIEPVQELAEGKVSRISAIEVLCPVCNSSCMDPQTNSSFITYDLIGHVVVCSACSKQCIVPFNAFSLSQSGDVVAREKSDQTLPNHLAAKKGRTKKEKKAPTGVKPKSGKEGDVRQPLQLSLNMRTINALTVMKVNKSALFEKLLNMYQPFLDALALVPVEDEVVATTEETGEPEKLEVE